MAFLVTPREAGEAITRSLWAMTWMAPPLTAEIVSRWIEDGTAAAVVDRKRAEARARCRIASEVLDGSRYRTTPDAYHLWLELPRPWRSEEFALACARRGVSISPAEAFAVARRDRGDAVRISLTGVERREDLRTGLTIVAEVLGTRPGPGLGM